MTQELSYKAGDLLERAYNFATDSGCEYFTPEHILYTILSDYSDALKDDVGINVGKIKQSLILFISNMNKNIQLKEKPKASRLLIKTFENAKKITNNEVSERIKLTHIIRGMYLLENSFASYLLHIDFSCSPAKYLTSSTIA